MKKTLISLSLCVALLGSASTLKAYGATKSKSTKAKSSVTCSNRKSTNSKKTSTKAIKKTTNKKTIKPIKKSKKKIVKYTKTTKKPIKYTKSKKAPVKQVTKKPIKNRYSVAGISNPKQFETTFNTIKNLVAKNKKSEVANHVSYPITVKINGKKVKISNKSQFVKNYNKIITPKVKKAFLNQNIGNSFVNYQGVMVGNGEVWLNQCKTQNGNYGILAINN